MKSEPQIKDIRIMLHSVDIKCRSDMAKDIDLTQPTTILCLRS